MSRIERAIEQAARTRQAQEVPPVPQPDRGESAVTSRRGPTGNAAALLQTRALEVNNLLLVACGEASQEVREEYHKLKSLVVRKTRGDNFANTLLVTSAVREEGKSLTVLNLGLTLAQELDHTVLLVDSDLRRPSLHRYLGLQPAAGLIQCLQGKATLPDVLIKTGLGKLVLLPAGGTVDNPAELLGSNRMLELIAELKHRYRDRYILFDTPPSLPFADAQVLSRGVDGLLFVAREAAAKLSDIAETLAGLDQDKLLGVIYNDALFPTKKGAYYYA